MVVEFKDDNFESELKTDQPVMVDFWAPWCGPCQMMGPIVEDFAVSMQGKAKIGKLNVDDNPVIAQKYGVMSIPTLIFFKGGREVKRLTGVQSKESLKEEISKLF